MAETKEAVETKTLEQQKIENAELWRQLTKRNEQYMINLDKILSQANFEEAKKADIFHGMMAEMVAAQKTGRTARQMYGTVSECAENLLQRGEENTPPKRSADWLIWLDGGLLIGSIFALISGVTLYTNPEQGTAGTGVISLIMNFLVGGLAMMIISKYMPNPNAPKGERGYGKYILSTVVAMLLWMLLMTLTNVYIPASINRALPALAYVIIGAVGMGVKILLKRKYRITGGLF